MLMYLSGPKEMIATLKIVGSNPTVSSKYVKMDKDKIDKFFEKYTDEELKIKFDKYKDKADKKLKVKVLDLLPIFRKGRDLVK